MLFRQFYFFFEFEVKNCIFQEPTHFKPYKHPAYAGAGVNGKAVDQSQLSNLSRDQSSTSHKPGSNYPPDNDFYSHNTYNNDSGPWYMNCFPNVMTLVTHFVISFLPVKLFWYYRYWFPHWNNPFNLERSIHSDNVVIGFSLSWLVSLSSKPQQNRI